MYVVVVVVVGAAEIEEYGVYVEVKTAGADVVVEVGILIVFPA